MLVIRISTPLDEPDRERVRKDLETRTGETCVFVPCECMGVERIKLKKEQPLWRRLLGLY